MKAALPDKETARLEELCRYKILDTPPEEAFDDITRLAAQICETPIALIGLLDRDRQWFKSKLGLTVTEIPRNISLCAHSLLEDEVFVLKDTLADERFAAHPLVRGEPFIGFVATVPLISPQGYTLGTLCVLDYVPRELKPQQLEALKALSRQVMAQLELRRNLAELADATQESQHLERQLNHRQEELLDVLENGTVGLHCVDGNGIILWANQAELDLLGYTREEYVGQHIANFHPDKVVIEDILQRLSRNETLTNYEAKLLCKDGSNRHVLINSSARFINGKFHHTRCFTRDITDYKHTQQVAQQAAVENLRLARASASVSDGVLITDPNQPDNPIIYANPAFFKITGYSPDEIMGRNCRFLQGSGTDRQTIDQIRQAIAERREVKATVLNYRKDGQPFWNELKISPVFSEEGELINFIGIQTDITDRKRVEEERDRFFTLTLDMLCIAGFDGYFKRLNPAFEKTLGYTHEELQSLPFLNFVHPDDRERTRAEMEKLAISAPTIDFENRYRCKDGSYKWLAWTAIPIVEEGVTYAIARDITERKQVEEERLQFLEREKVARTEAEAAKNRVTNILESITDAFFALDREWRFTYLNPRAELLLQRTKEELLGHKIWDEFPEAVNSTFYQEYHTAVSQGITVTFEGFYSPLNIWFEVHAYPSEEGLSVYFNDISDRKRAEEVLRKREQRFQLIARATNDALWEWDLLTDAVWWNDGVQTLFGYSAAEVRLDAAWWYEGIHPEDRERVASSLDVVFNKGEVTWSDAYRYRRSDGSYAYVFDRGYVIHDDRGKPIRMIGGMMDITERKQAEEALQCSLKDLADMKFALEQSAIVAITDHLGIINYVNDKFCEISKYSKEELLGKTHRVVNSGYHSKEFFDQMWATISSGQVWKGEIKNQAKDGTFYWVDTTIVPLLNGEGKPYQYIAIRRDISESKRAEEQIREQATLLDKSQDAILVLNLHGRILFWNKSAKRLFGWTGSEALGSKMDRLLFKDDAPPQLDDAEKMVLERGEWHGEMRHVTKDGKKIIVESRWTLVRDEAEKPKSILIVNTDITEKKQLESQFLRAQRMESIGTLAGGIAHDLNNVLAPILMTVQLLQLKLLDDRSQQWLEILEANAKRGADLVKQVVSFARGIDGDRTIVQVRHIISEIRQIARETFPKSIQLYIDVRPDLWTVSGDATQLHQVLMNLCVNARDAMPDGGRLSICGENLVIDENYARMHIDAKVGSYIAITISDTGGGIPPEILDRIFEPFFTTKKLGKGTGLGLSTVMGILKSHGGFVNVYSEMGQGTEFKVYLPAMQETETSTVEDIELPRGQGELILVVDDEAAISKITQTSLETYGYQVLTASDGIEAIASYAQHKADISLVLIDMMMPNMDGPTTIRTLQKIQPEVKIIAVSGLASSDKLVQARCIGVTSFLSKPYTAKELLTTISEVLTTTD